MDTYQKRNKIIKSISQVSDSQLEDLYQYISQLDKKNQDKRKQKKFAGIWRDLDDEVYKELTENLIDNRRKSKRRFD
mgnify:FL=1